MPHPPVTWDGPPELQSATATFNAGRRPGTVFLHERRSPSGRRVLVWAAVRGGRENSYVSDSRQGGYVATIKSKCRLVTWVIEPATSQKGGGQTWMHELQFDQAQHRRLKLRFNPDRSAPDAGDGELAQEPSVMRFLAGRGDVRDASHFELEYTLDGWPGTIDVWVRDDGRLQVEPRDGTQSIERYDATRGAETWDPHGTPAAAAPPR